MWHFKYSSITSISHFISSRIISFLIYSPHYFDELVLPFLILYILICTFVVVGIYSEGHTLMSRHYCQSGLMTMFLCFVFAENHLL